MLEFDAVTHTYLWDGMPVPSVTQIIGEWRQIDVFGVRYFCNTFTGAVVAGERFTEARDYGRALHLMLCLHLRGDLDRDVLHADLAGMLAQFEAWQRQYRVEPILIEQPLFTERHRYAGTPDLVCKINGRTAIVDYKTGGHDMAGVQLAGYAGLYQPAVNKQRFTLHMPRGGELKAIRHSSAADYAFFNARLIQHQYLTKG